MEEEDGLLVPNMRCRQQSEPIYYTMLSIFGVLFPKPNARPKASIRRLADCLTSQDSHGSGHKRHGPPVQGVGTTLDASTSSLDDGALRALCGIYVPLGHLN